MAITLAEVVNLAGSIENATRAAFGVYDDDLRPRAENEAAALAADRAILGAIFANPLHRYYLSTLAFITVANGGIIPSQFVGIKIDGQAGKYVDLDRLALNRTTAISGLLALCSGQYAIEKGSHVLFYIGTTASVATPTYTPSGTLSSPDEYLYAVIAGILALTFPKEGAFVAAGAHYAALFDKMLGIISRDGQLPGITVYQPGFTI